MWCLKTQKGEFCWKGYTNRRNITNVFCYKVNVQFWTILYMSNSQTALSFLRTWMGDCKSGPGKGRNIVTGKGRNIVTGKGRNIVTGKGRNIVSGKGRNIVTGKVRAET